ncbi:MAG: hypothetical protein QHH06_12540 [Clostridiales bacterium]|jgi:P pilus assembly chaperone PapD|nr:hypothetical protein [Eubacteriales bacterium]MDH7567278.1 hypothetical protein [Clostridiales bacterium]
MRRTLKITVFFTIIFLLMDYGRVSYTTNSGGVVVGQTRVTFQADKDSGLKVPVTIKNTSDEEMAVSVKKADFEIDNNGVFQVREPGSTANSAFDYIVCEESEFKMPANSTKVIEISLAKDKAYALPEYNSAILVKYAPVSMVQSEAQVKTYIQTPIIVTVNPGSLVKVDFDTSVPPISLSRIGFSRIMNSGGEKTLAFYFKNSGVITIQPNLTAAVSGLISGENVSIPYGATGIPPGTNKEYSFKFKPAGWFDIYTVRLNYDYGYGGKKFSDYKAVSFVVVSYRVLIGIVLICIGILAQIRINRKRNRLLKQLLAEKEAVEGKNTIRAEEEPGNTDTEKSEEE